MSKFTLAAGTSPFAHLLAGAAALGARAAGRRAEDPENDDPEDKDREGSRAEDPENDDPEDKDREGSRAEDPENDDPEDKDREGGRAEDDDMDAGADATDDDDDDDGGYKDEKARKAYRRGLAAGRARENLRASRIFGNPAAAARPDLAATLAFSTRNSSAEAIAILGAATTLPGLAQGAGRLDRRMANRADARPGADGGNARPSFGDRVAAAVKKAGAR